VDQQSQLIAKKGFSAPGGLFAKYLVKTAVSTL
jgi:hypothetical protein